MKILIVTVAGTATRFNQDCLKPSLKCIYTDKNHKYTILERLLTQTKDYDCFVIVGGYLFEELRDYVETKLSHIQQKIELVYNPHFADRGSMYSLYLGLNKAKEYHPDELLFAEGDLIVDDESLQKVVMGKQDAITANKEIIWANKAVVAYLDVEDRLHYLYDTSHSQIKFEFDVKAIFNSAQIWKFRNTEKLFTLNTSLTEQEKASTNLVLIQKYFGELKFEQFDCIEIKQWFNCNTVKDYQIGMQQVQYE